MAVPPNRSPPLVTPTLTGGRPSSDMFAQAPFFFLFSAMKVCVSGAWKSITGPGAPKSSVLAFSMGSLRSSM